MKVAIISHHFPPKYNAGAEQYAYRIAQGLKKQGLTVEVVCIESIIEGSLIPSCTSDTYKDILVHRLYFDINKAPDRFEWSFCNPELGAWVRDYLRHFRPDVVHVNSGYLLGGTVLESAYDLGIPVVLTLQDYWFLCPSVTLLRQNGQICDEQVPPSRCAWCLISEKRRYKLPDRFFRGFLGDLFVQLNQSKIITKVISGKRLKMIVKRREYLKQVFEKIDLAISPSCFVMNKVKSYGFQPRKIEHIPYGIDKKLLSVQKSIKDLTKLSIGYLGQIVHHKGVYLLLDAFKRLKKQTRSCELSLHGNIERDSRYVQRMLKIAANDPGIKFAGPYENTKVDQILNNLDVIVIPSIWYDNQPTVILEALATRTPVIASAIGGIPELIKHNQNGLLFKAGSSKELLEQLQRILDEQNLLEKLRENIEPMKSIQEEITELTSLYSSAINKDS